MIFQRHWFNGVVCLFVWLVEVADMQPARAFGQSAGIDISM